MVITKIANKTFVPETDELANIFDQLNLLMVKNDGSDYYVPSYNVDQIGIYDNRDGYKVFLNGPGTQTMEVEGLPVDASWPIDLSPYLMNIMPYLPEECMATSDVFAGYDDDILVVKNDDSDYYVPAYNVETLSTMCPGEGYAIFLNGANGIDFTYPMGMALNHSEDHVNDYKARAHVDVIDHTGESHLVLLTEVAGEIKVGDQLRAYAHNELVGAINIVPEHLDGRHPIDLVAVGGADLSQWDGPVLDGYLSGDMIDLRLYSFERDIELLVDSNLDQSTYGNAMEMSVGTINVLDQTAIATSFELTQNYPNPFNPSTMIEYNIEAAGHVSLKVYDVMGRLVRTLVDEYQEAGYGSGYNVLWNGLDNMGNQVSAGIYIYSLQSDNMITTKKMVLMK